MKTLLVSFALWAALQDPAPPAQEPVPADPPPVAFVVDTIKRTSSDGIELTADYYKARGKIRGPIVVACHMEGGSRGEYQKVAAEFVTWGCSVLAVDLRCGKESNGVPNATAAFFEAKNGKPAVPADAYADLVEAVKWARETRSDAKVLLCGSGYSAALAVVYAAREPKGVEGVIACSPGEVIEGWNVSLEAKGVLVPVHVCCGNGIEERTRAVRIFNALDKKVRSQFFPNDSMICPPGAQLLVQEEPNTRNRVWTGVLKIVRGLSEAQPAAGTPEAPPKNG